MAGFVRLSSVSRRAGSVDDEGADDVSVSDPNDLRHAAGRTIGQDAGGPGDAAHPAPCLWRAHNPLHGACMCGCTWNASSLASPIPVKSVLLPAPILHFLEHVCCIVVARRRLQQSDLCLLAGLAGERMLVPVRIDPVGDDAALLRTQAVLIYRISAPPPLAPCARTQSMRDP